VAAEPDELIIGRIAKAHGLSGAVKIEPLTDFPERFRDLKTVLLQPAQGPAQARGVLGAEVSPEGVILRLEGCVDRAAAEALRGAYLKIKRADAVALPPDHYFIADIVGLEVVTPAGVSLGRITEVIRTGANDVYVTPKAMIPALRDVVKSVDLKAGRMVAEPWEELA
jgi:16S rRNA processing protein RimM